MLSATRELEKRGAGSPSLWHTRHRSLEPFQLGAGASLWAKSFDEWRGRVGTRTLNHGS